MLLLIAGFIAYRDIPKESDPDINIPIVYVALSHEGISPEDAERLLVRPTETALRAIEGTKELRAQAFDGGANVILQFEAGFDVDAALADVREKVDLIKSDLPEDSDEPTVHEVNLSLFPILVVTLSGKVPERAVLKIARDLKDDLIAIPEVLDVKITGDREEVVEIVIDPLLVESYGLEPATIFSLIARSNLLVAAGALDTGRGRFSIKVPGLFETAADILEMPLQVNGDAVVKIRDIAVVKRTFKDVRTYARVDGKSALALEISKRAGENIIDTITNIKAVVDAAHVDWPQGLEVAYGQDRSTDIRRMSSDLQNNVIAAILLVMIVVVAALGVLDRSSRRNSNSRLFSHRNSRACRDRTHRQYRRAVFAHPGGGPACRWCYRRHRIRRSEDDRGTGSACGLCACSQAYVMADYRIHCDDIGGLLAPCILAWCGWRVYEVFADHIDRHALCLSSDGADIRADRGRLYRPSCQFE